MSVADMLLLGKVSTVEEKMLRKNLVPEVVRISKPFNVLNVHVVVKGDEVGLVVHMQHTGLDVLV
jgi:hypothetical protein